MKSCAHIIALTFVWLWGSTASPIAQPKWDSVKTKDTINFLPIVPDKDTSRLYGSSLSRGLVASQLNNSVLSKQIPSSNSRIRALWHIFLAGLLGGFAAVLMPCIFPMLPLTISFFVKKRGKTFVQALWYGLSIVVVYVTLGCLITLCLGADALNTIATSGAVNMFSFLLLILFAIALFGAFELTMPRTWVHKMDVLSQRGGWIGIFFMACTLALVSFSCTGPIVGTLLVSTATEGVLLGPIVGMFGFSLALACPFTVFALIPSALKTLPKSGGWLNNVKVVLGFLELALALKFLSNVDLAYHWNFLDREVFLSLWIVIFSFIGLYLLGKLPFAYDSNMHYLSIPRVFLSIVTFAFVVYLLPGLWGAPLKSISAFLPPTATQDFNLHIPAVLADYENSSAKPWAQRKKYQQLFHQATPLGLDPFYDYEEALLVSKKVKKPVLIDFTGWNCANCRKMEHDVWSNPEVLQRLKQDFVLVTLYVDDKTKLPYEERYQSKFSGKMIKTIGAKWSDFQSTQFNNNAQPYYVIVDSDGTVLLPPQGANYDPKNYIDFLDRGKKIFHQQWSPQ